MVGRMLMDRKGFMMAELIVVSAIVLVTLVGIYNSYIKLFTTYETRIRYYDVSSLYRLGYYRDFLIENNSLDRAKPTGTSKIKTVYDYKNGEGFSVISIDAERNSFGSMIGDRVYMIHNDKNSINSSIFDDRTVNFTFKEYVDFLEKSIDFSGFEYMMIIERCAIKDNTSNDVDINDCTYAYLEIFE